MTSIGGSKGEVGPPGTSATPFPIICASQVRAVGQKSFASVKRDFFPCPVNLIANPIRDVNFALASRSNEARSLEAETQVMSRDHRIKPNCSLELS